MKPFAPFLKKFLPDKKIALQARSLYARILREARDPEFYRSMGAADTPEGRFEMIVLHMWLALRTIKADSPDLARNLTENFFADMEASLREAGIGDMGVPPRMKRMASAFYGRLAAYDQALGGSAAELAESLKNNLYALSPTEKHAQKYAEKMARHLIKRTSKDSKQRTE